AAVYPGDRDRADRAGAGAGAVSAGYGEVGKRQQPGPSEDLRSGVPRKCGCAATLTFVADSSGQASRGGPRRKQGERVGLRFMGGPGGREINTHAATTEVVGNERAPRRRVQGSKPGSPPDVLSGTDVHRCSRSTNPPPAPLSGRGADPYGAMT